MEESEVTVDKNKNIRKWDLVKVAFRSFFIQNLWSFERMQAYGFLYCMLPIINRLYRSREDRASSCKRHLEVINTQPYLAPFILGVAIAREERYAQGDEDDISQVSFAKNCMMGPLAGMGDQLFWASLRPFLMLLGVSIVFLGWDKPNIGLWGPIVFLVIYNIFHLYVRWHGLVSGYREDIEVVKRLRDFNRLGLMKGFRVAGFLLVGGIAAFQIGTIGTGGAEPFKIVLLFALIVSLGVVSKIKMASAKMIALLTLLFSAGAYWGWMFSF